MQKFELKQHLEKYLRSQQAHQQNLLQLLDSWQEEDIQEDHETWEDLKRILDESRLHDQKLLPVKST